MTNQLTTWRDLVKIFWCEIKIRFGFARPIALVNFLLSPDSETRWNAADSLYTYHDQTLVASVFDILQKETNGHVRTRLIWILVTNQAWDELFLCLDSSKFDVRTHAADALTRCGETRFVEPLLKQMRENDNQDYIYRSILMGIVDASSVGLLFEYLSNATPSMTKGLLELLGASEDQQTFGYLLVALKDPNAEIREGAVLGLMHLGDSQAIEPLRELLDDPSEYIQGLIVTALHILEQHLPHSVE
jgi:HEAT repeat protein